MEEPAAIRCRDVTKRFVLDISGTLWKLLRADPNMPSFTALHGIDLRVPPGEFVGLLGRNGAGKSTLLRTIGGVYAPDRGSIRVNGQMTGLYELGIGGNEHLDGSGFARGWFDIVGTNGRDIDALIDEIRDFSELDDAFARPIRTYSSGMRARLYFAVATALPAEVYVIDEMLSVGDEYFQNKCWRRLRERLGKGASGLLATHDWSAILKLCPTCHILDKGRITAGGRSPDIVRDYLGNKAAELSSGAKFSTGLPERVSAQSRAPFAMDITIDVSAPGTVQFGASIERFLPGHGWEHVMHCAPRTVVETIGRHALELAIPRLPLPEATYSLGLFLTLTTAEGARLVTDVRSWTYGNALYLDVAGQPSKGAVLLPMTIIRTAAVAERGAAA